MEVAREAVALLFGDLHHAEPLDGQVAGELDVLQRDIRLGRQRLRVPLVLGAKRPVVMVHRLEHADTAAVP